MSVVVVGAVNQDLVAFVARHPAAGETVHGHGFATGDGGKAANQAVAAARACGKDAAPVRLLAAVGDDAYGERVVAQMARRGVDVRFVKTVAGQVTGTAVITVEDDGENRIIIVPGANGQVDAEMVHAAERDGLFRDCNVVLGQLEVNVDATLAAMAAGRRAGARTVLNVAPATTASNVDLSNVDLVVVNEGEREMMAEQLKGKDVLVTLGARGARFNDDAVVDAVRVETVVDTTGAGDSYLGTLAAHLAGGADMAQAMQHAAAAAAKIVAQRGAQGEEEE